MNNPRDSVTPSLEAGAASVPPAVSQRPKVGVGVVVWSRRNDATNVLWVGRRKGSHGSAKWALPGGHLEYGESWEECARREVQEEMGVTLSSVEFLHVTNDVMSPEKKHYITIFMVGELVDPVHHPPVNREPEKCEGWEPYTVSQLLDMVHRNELFLPLENLLKEMPEKLLRLTES